jgi:NAD(P)H-hydrate repair Nnr-like enzyme with NAD(P)H-hydrate dehydratase domain
VLAGIIGALVAGRHRELAGNPALLGQLAATGAFIHARAADLACDGAPLTASGLIAAIAPTVRSLLQ